MSTLVILEWFNKILLGLWKVVTTPFLMIWPRGMRQVDITLFSKAQRGLYYVLSTIGGIVTIAIVLEVLTIAGCIVMDCVLGISC